MLTDATHRSGARGHGPGTGNGTETGSDHPSRVWTVAALLRAHRQRRRVALGRLASTSSLPSVVAPPIRESLSKPSSTASLSLVPGSAHLRSVNEAAATTHLSVQSLNISLFAVDTFEHFKRLKVLFLYDNQLESLDPLAPLEHSLERLYIQNNRISTLAPLSGFSLLTALDASGNFIEYLDQLSLPSLEDLTLDRQRTSEEGGIHGDASTLSFPSLQTVSVSHSGMTDPGFLIAFRAAESVTLAHNQLADLGSLVQKLRLFRRLASVDVSGNQFGPEKRTRERFVTDIPWLDTINGKVVPATERHFLLSHHVRTRDHMAAAAAGGHTVVEPGTEGPDSRPPPQSSTSMHILTGTGSKQQSQTQQKPPRLLPAIEGLRPPSMSTPDRGLGALAGFRGASRALPMTAVVMSDDGVDTFPSTVEDHGSDMAVKALLVEDTHPIDSIQHQQDMRVHLICESREIRGDSAGSASTDNTCGGRAEDAALFGGGRPPRVSMWEAHFVEPPATKTVKPVVQLGDGGLACAREPLPPSNTEFY